MKETKISQKPELNSIFKFECESQSMGLEFKAIANNDVNINVQNPGFWKVGL
eukprot:Awhi_evm1s13983